MDIKLEYDETDPLSIEEYGQKLIGKSFRMICDEDDIYKAMVLGRRLTMLKSMRIRNEKVVWVRL